VVTCLVCIEFDWSAVFHARGQKLYVLFYSAHCNVPYMDEIFFPLSEMDDLLVECFLKALKSRVTKSDLPLLASTFYRSFVLVLW